MEVDLRLSNFYKGLKGWMCQRERSAHVFASHLLLGELDFNEGLDCGEELPPWPVLHTTVLVDVLLDTTDC